MRFSSNTRTTERGGGVSGPSEDAAASCALLSKHRAQRSGPRAPSSISGCVPHRALPYRLLTVVGLALLLAACDDFDPGGWNRYQEDFHFSYPLAAGGKIDVENVNGEVDISGWEKNTVEINGTKYSNSKSTLDGMKIDVVPAADSIHIRTLPAVPIHGGAGARYSIRVPRHTVLERIVSSNGGVHIDDIQGNANVHTSNGGIRVERLQGDLDAQTSNGRIEAHDTHGNCFLHTSNGRIEAEDAGKGAFEATSSNGSVHVRLSEPDPDHPVKIETSNGSIDLALESAREVRSRTSNSSITLHLPESLNAHLRARTSNSSINSDFDVTVHGGTLSKHSLDGDIGKGGPLIDLVTSNGGIKIVKE
ncbi:MAG TPA: DUF4097 family beta strand repeat-containing protein [Bryobacteraceae bacterium]|nr:DUF4097 family beta strand repeat-containing protein [Bryobacteraceae bacterium]